MLWISLFSLLLTASMTWLCTFWLVLGIRGLSLLITHSKSGKKNRNRGKNFKGFLLFTCICSSALLKIAAAVRVIFLQQSKRAAVRLSTTCYRFPLLCDCGFAHAGYSPSQHVHQIQEVSELPCVCGRATAHPAGSVSTLRLACRGGASRKPFLHNLLFRPKQGVAQSLAEKLGVAVAPVCCWAKRGGSCHRGKSSSPKPAPLGPLGSCCPRGAARSPPAIWLALPFSTATYIYFLYMLHWERESSNLVDASISV